MHAVSWAGMQRQAGGKLAGFGLCTGWIHFGQQAVLAAGHVSAIKMSMLMHTISVAAGPYFYWPRDSACGPKRLSLGLSGIVLALL